MAEQEVDQSRFVTDGEGILINGVPWIPKKPEESPNKQVVNRSEPETLPSDFS